MATSRLKMRSFYRHLLLAASCLILSLPPWIEAAKPKRHVITQMQAIGPHGGHIAEDKDHRFEVKMDPEKGSVNIYTLRSNDTLPPSMSIILFGDPSKGRTVELKAVDPSQTLPRYEGQVSVANASFIGFAIQIG